MSRVPRSRVSRAHQIPPEQLDQLRLLRLVLDQRLDQDRVLLAVRDVEAPAVGEQEVQRGDEGGALVALLERVVAGDAGQQAYREDGEIVLFLIGPERGRAGGGAFELVGLEDEVALAAAGEEAAVDLDDVAGAQPARLISQGGRGSSGSGAWRIRPPRRARPGARPDRRPALLWLRPSSSGRPSCFSNEPPRGPILVFRYYLICTRFSIGFGDRRRAGAAPATVRVSAAAR